jgi:hypothetical protein
VPIAIARQSLDLVRQIRLTPPAGEDRDAVAARHRMPYEMRADEASSAEDEQIERGAGRLRTEAHRRLRERGRDTPE